MQDQYPLVGCAALALSKSTGDIAANHRHRLRPVGSGPWRRRIRWLLIRHPYHNRQPIYDFCYLASSCPGQSFEQMLIAPSRESQELHHNADLPFYITFSDLAIGFT